LDVQSITQLFRALGDETRVRIVALLSQGELCVCHIEEALEISQPNASRHLSVLRSAGVVEPRREGNWIYYRLAHQADDECRKVLTAVKALRYGRPCTRTWFVCARPKGPERLVAERGEPRIVRDQNRWSFQLRGTGLHLPVAGALARRIVDGGSKNGVRPKMLQKQTSTQRRSSAADRNHESFAADTDALTEHE
jgi:ArsR family transcriptional regulator